MGSLWLNFYRCVDTALSYVIKQANEIIEKDIERFISFREKLKLYTLMMGRTHGVHTEQHLVLKWHYGIQK